jgi:hypothetical protein
MDMDRRLRTVLLVAAAALALPVAGCASSDSPLIGASPSSPAPSASSPGATPTTPPPPPSTGNQPPPPATGTARVVVRRTGGIAGVQQTLIVQPNGEWAYTSNRAGQSGGKQLTGKLTADQMSQLQAQLRDPDLATEARNRPGPGHCNDGFNYVVSVGDISIAWQSCMSSNEPKTATEIARLLSAWTAM